MEGDELGAAGGKTSEVIDETEGEGSQSQLIDEDEDKQSMTRQRVMTEKGREYQFQHCLNVLRKCERAYNKVLNEVSGCMSELDRTQLDVHNKEIRTKYDDVVHAVHKMYQLGLSEHDKERLPTTRRPFGCL